MKIINKASVLGFFTGFICFPIIFFVGGYLYVNFAFNGFENAVSLDPPEMPSEQSVNLDWQVKTLDGFEVNLKEHVGDKTVFLNFWATWCPPCVAEMPSIDTLYELFGDTMMFVCISQENAETLKKFLQAKQYSFPVFYTETPPPQELNAAALPTTFIVSSDGQILLKHVGGADWAHESVVAFLREKLAQG